MSEQQVTSEKQQDKLFIILLFILFSLQILMNALMEAMVAVINFVPTLREASPVTAVRGTFWLEMVDAV